MDKFNQDDVIIIGQSSVGFNVVCQCGNKHYHAIERFTSTCPECRKKKVVKVKDLPEFIFHTLKTPIWLTLIKFKTMNKLRIHANENHIHKEKEFIKMFEEIGLKAKEIGFTEDMNRNKGKKIQVYEYELRKRIF